MLGSLSGSKLGIWVAHGEGKFNLPEPLEKYNIVAKYNNAAYIRTRYLPVAVRILSGDSP